MSYGVLNFVIVGLFYFGSEGWDNAVTRLLILLCIGFCW